ncbi:MAG TPA: ribose ABC transporter substrate-binding protein RbsB [Sporosarcina sp.]|nr:ribose ABC transporter substrate-binding protein RbsB [Sporosarcina sp.]
MKKIGLLIGLLFVLAACSLEPPAYLQNNDQPIVEGDAKIGFSISTLNNPFFVTLNDGAKEKAAELGAELTIIDAQDNAAKQASDVEDLIQQGVDLIMINPTDSEAVASAVEAANLAGIPVITVDRNAEGGEVLAHIASDNVAGGELAAEYLVELVGKDAKVAELEGISGSSAARDRGAGFNKIAAEQLDIVAKQTANFNRSEGLTVMENILQGQPDIQGVFAHNDEMALGALEAIKTSGKDIVVIGFDATDDAVQAVEDGTLAGTVAQKPELIGETAIDIAVKALKGEEVDEFVPVELELVK